jgi:hypothetical protein
LDETDVRVRDGEGAANGGGAADGETVEASNGGIDTASRTTPTTAAVARVVFSNALFIAILWADAASVHTAYGCSLRRTGFGLTTAAS